MQNTINRLVIFSSLFLIIFSSTSVIGYENKNTYDFDIEICDNSVSEDFYFIQITDTHVLHRFFDFNEKYKNRLTLVLDEIRSFDNKPAFIVITGDLVEWGGIGITGALNCKTFVECFYEKDEQLYLDSDFTIPIYTTPGNHDYRWSSKLSNYNRIIDNRHPNNRYEILYENLSLFFLDSGHDYLLNPLGWFRQGGLHVKGSGLTEDDLQWLNESLVNSTSKFKAVLMHHPAIDHRDRFGDMLDVIANNRQGFIDICEYNNVEIVLTGHTHRNSIYDFEENPYTNLFHNCSLYSTLYVQTDDCKNNYAYRNISILKNDIWIEPTQYVIN